ncbi:unnamed protein product [Camellia sinensis]
MMYVKASHPPDMNRNTEWFTYPGVWTTYILILFFSWLIVLSLFGCSPGMAWTIVNLSHFAGFIGQVTYHFFHWKKGTPFADDQGIYNGLTWWEQIDHGKQLTRNRKFLTVVPVVLYLIASHTTDYQHPMLFFNTLAVFVLVVAKFPNMHKVRIFGINGEQYHCEEADFQLYDSSLTRGLQHDHLHITLIEELASFKEVIQLKRYYRSS